MLKKITTEAETFRRENYIIADIIVFLENLIFRNIPDEDLPSAILRAIGSRLMLDAKTIRGSNDISITRVVTQRR